MSEPQRPEPTLTPEDEAIIRRIDGLGSWPVPQLVAEIDRLRAEARAAERTETAAISLAIHALEGLTLNAGPVECWCEEWPADGLHTLQCEQARYALVGLRRALAADPPEPSDV